MRIPRAQEIYRHFKGNLYQIITVAEHSETEELLVIYQALYGEFKVYARPLSMFCEKVDREKYPDVVQEYRFEIQNSYWGNREEKGMVKETEVKDSKTYDMPTTVKMVDDEEKENWEQCGDLMDVSETEAVELDAGLLEFLDADTYTQRLNVLTGLHHRITDDMLTTMAIACDVEVEEGDLEERYQSLKNCLLTLERYEISRI